MATEALQQLKDALAADPVPLAEKVYEALYSLATLIPEGSNRQELTSAGAYEVIISAWKYFCNTGIENVRVLTPEAEFVREGALHAVAALSEGHSEIIDEFGFIMIYQAFYNLTSPATKLYGLQFMRNICTGSEPNRETLAAADKHNIGEPFVHLLKRSGAQVSAELIREWCAAAAAFTAADDPSEATNLSVVRKRILHTHQAHRYLCEFLINYSDEETLNQVVQGLNLIATNPDYCVAIESCGGLRGLFRILEEFNSDADLVKNTLICLRYMYTSPIVRTKSSSLPMIRLILQLTGSYGQQDEEFIEIGLSALAFLTQENPCACAQLLIEKGVHKVLEMLNQRPESESIAKSVCLILQNVATHADKIGRSTILHAGGEAALRAIGDKFPDLVANLVNPLLDELKREQLGIPKDACDDDVSWISKRKHRNKGKR